MDFIAGVFIGEILGIVIMTFAIVPKLYSMLDYTSKGDASKGDIDE